MTGFANGRKFVDLARTTLGLFLVAVPLALWVAWSETAFFLVLAVGVAAAVLVCLLARVGEPKLEDGRNAGERIELTDQFVAELHRLFPLVHHHRRPGDSVFQRKMDRLKKLLSG